MRSVTGGFLFIYFFRLWHNRMPYVSLSGNICYSNLMSGQDYRKKKHLPALAADKTSAFSHVFPLGALGCPGVCSLYYFPFQSFILI